MIVNKITQIVKKFCKIIYICTTIFFQKCKTDSNSKNSIVDLSRADQAINFQALYMKFKKFYGSSAIADRRADPKISG